LKEGIFLEAFTDKGRFRALLEGIPVWVILNSEAALVGAAIHAAGIHAAGIPALEMDQC
jgi:glucokinase